VLAPQLALRKSWAPNGLPYAMLCEQLCWMAIGAGDTAELDQQLEHVARVYKVGGHPGLLAKYERLLNAARDKEVGSSLAQGIHATSRVEAQLMTRLQTEIRGFSTTEQTQRLLQLVLDEAQAQSGYLYRAASDGMARLLANRNVTAPNPVLEIWVNQYLAKANPLDSICTETGDHTESYKTQAILVRDERSKRYLPLMLREPQGLRVLAVVLIGCPDEVAPPTLSHPFINAVTRTLQAIFRDESTSVSKASTGNGADIAS
jgi:hypothetical protein